MIPSENVAPRQPLYQRVMLVIGLFFLSPLVAEFLLGNIAIDAVWVLLFVAPLYGGGAVLVREVARHSKRGWPTIFFLAFAYAVIEEGLITQSLFNRHYFGSDLHAWANVPALGIGAWWTIYVLTIHTIWSIAVPIALVESLASEHAKTPWLNTPGCIAIALLFLLGAAMTFYTTYEQEGFIASTTQLTCTVVVTLAIIFAAFGVRRISASRFNRNAPRPWVVGSVSFLASSIFSLGLYLPGWFTVAVWLSLTLTMTVLVARWSRCVCWDNRHVLAVAGGALITYAWQGFPHSPVIGSGGSIDLAGNAIFAIGALTLLGFAIKTNKSSNC